MSNIETRLVKSFQKVFPNLTTVEEVKTAGEDTLVEWDSIRVVSLIFAIEEEFGDGIIDFDEIDKLTSFVAFQTYLEKR